MRFYLRVIPKGILIFFVLSSVCFVGCKSKKIITKPEPEKVNTADQEGTTIEYEEAVKRHFEMQSDRTKRMILSSDKKRMRKNSGKNRKWYDKLFNNSCGQNSKMVKTGHTQSSITKRSSCFVKE
jgi:hypothetical protein